VVDNANAISLRSVAEQYIQAPTRENLGRLTEAAEAYRDRWIETQASISTTSPHVSRKEVPTSYQRELEVSRVVDGILVKLALQERTSAKWPTPWWVLSWRTRYSADGSNRRFYNTKDGYWTIPAAIALDMLEEMEQLGGLGDEYHDTRRRPSFEAIVSTELAAQDRKERLDGITGTDENWGEDPLFVIAEDPNDLWKKVMIVGQDGTATFRSITRNPEYMPKKVIRQGVDWWLDNSMMDANVQQMRAFYTQLKLLVKK
jgi:hypothetical protein